MYSSNCYSTPSYMSFDGETWTTVTPTMWEEDVVVTNPSTNHSNHEEPRFHVHWDNEPAQPKHWRDEPTHQPHHWCSTQQANQQVSESKPKSKHWRDEPTQQQSYWYGNKQQPTQQPAQYREQPTQHEQTMQQKREYLRNKAYAEHYLQKPKVKQEKKRGKRNCKKNCCNCCECGCSSNKTTNNSTSFVSSLNMSNTYEVFYNTIVQCLSYYSANTEKNGRLATSLCEYFDVVKPTQSENYRQLWESVIKKVIPKEEEVQTPTNQQMLDLVKSLSSSDQGKNLLSAFGLALPEQEIISAINSMINGTLPTAPNPTPVPTTPTSVPTPVTKPVSEPPKKPEPTTKTVILTDKAKADLANSFLNLFETAVDANGNETTKQMFSMFRTAVAGELNSEKPKQEQKESNIEKEPTNTTNNILDNVFDDYIARTSCLVDSVNDESD